jgi:hypothetical protein
MTTAIEPAKEDRGLRFRVAVKAACQAKGWSLQQAFKAGV